MAKSIRYYLEFPSPANKRRRDHNTGNCVAIFTDTGHHYQSDYRYEAIASPTLSANGHTCSTTVTSDYLRSQCVRVSEAIARVIHPRLFEIVDSLNVGL